MLTVDGGGVEDILNFDLAITSSRKKFYDRMKFLETKGFSRDKIIDGHLFMIPNLDFPRFLSEGIAYGVFESANAFSDNLMVMYPRSYKFKNKSKATLNLGIKSHINFSGSLETISFRESTVNIGKFCSISWRNIFEIDLSGTHNSQAFSTYHPDNWNWPFPRELLPPRGKCEISIGNDVWSGRGCVFKCDNPNKPLIIGDGAVIAADSVVVKNVPPYAIVGGNPAQVIKYRFPPEIVEALLRIKWWDWDIDKIYDNFKYFNDIERFVALHDK